MKANKEFKNYLHRIPEAWGIVGGVAHRRHSHSLRTNSQLSVTYTPTEAQALNATLIIETRAFSWNRTPLLSSFHAVL